MPATYTTCRKCGQPKEVINGSPYCRPCNNAYHRAWLKKHGERIRTTCCHCHGPKEANTASYCHQCARDRPHTCTKCGADARGSTGSYCAACHRKYTNERRKVMPELAERAKQRTRALRRTAIAAYGGECTCCGEARIEFLAIDHVAGGGAQHRKSGTRNASRIESWLKDHDYPDGFRVLCHNCNLAYGFYGYCPHQQAALSHLESTTSRG